MINIIIKKTKILSIYVLLLIVGFLSCDTDDNDGSSPRGKTDSEKIAAILEKNKNNPEFRQKINQLLSPDKQIQSNQSAADIANNISSLPPTQIQSSLDELENDDLKKNYGIDINRMVDNLTNIANSINEELDKSGNLEQRREKVGKLLAQSMGVVMSEFSNAANSPIGIEFYRICK